MKKGQIVRADGSVLEWVEVAPFTFRLTLCSKPYNVCDSINEQFAERAENDED
jgi:hypothetical protein